MQIHNPKNSAVAQTLTSQKLAVAHAQVLRVFSPKIRIVWDKTEASLSPLPHIVIHEVKTLTKRSCYLYAALLCQFSVLILAVQVDTGVLIPRWVVAPLGWPSGGPFLLPCFQGPPNPLPFRASRVQGPTPRPPSRPRRDPSPPLARAHQDPTQPASRQWSTLRPLLLKPSSEARSWRRTVRSQTGCLRQSSPTTSSSAQCRRACSSRTTVVTDNSSSSSSSNKEVEDSTTSSTKVRAALATEALATRTARIWISTTFQSLWSARAVARGRMITTTLGSTQAWPTTRQTDSPTDSTSQTTPPYSLTGPTQSTRTPMPFSRISSPRPGWEVQWELPRPSLREAEADWTTASRAAARTTSGWTGGSDLGSTRTMQATRRATTDWDQSRGVRQRKAWARGPSIVCRHRPACSLRTSGGTATVSGSIGFSLRTDKLAKTEQKKVKPEKDEVLYDTHCVTHWASHYVTPCVTHTHTHTHTFEREGSVT